MLRVCVVRCNPTLQAKKQGRRAAVELEAEPQPAACVEEVLKSTTTGGEGAVGAAEPAVRPKPGRATAWQGQPAHPV